MLESYPDILTTKDLQRILPKNKNFIYELLKSGRLKSFKLGRDYMILKSDLSDFLKSHYSGGMDV